jgi:hypothetical protein
MANQERSLQGLRIRFATAIHNICAGKMRKAAHAALFTDIPILDGASFQRRSDLDGMRLIEKKWRKTLEGLQQHMQRPHECRGGQRTF